MIAIYAIAKFLAYSAWCYLGLRLAHPPSATIGRSMRLGAIRWLIGLMVGIAVFFAVGSIEPADAYRTYFVVYSPVRLIEWGVMAALIASREPRASGSGAIVRLALWCLGGIAVSFLTDLVSPEGIEGRLCVGRCLC